MSNTTATSTDFNNNNNNNDIYQLPSEIWEKIFLLISAFKDLFQTSTVCREFYHLIWRKQFLQKYSSYNNIQEDLLVWCRFSKQTPTDDLLYNSVVVRSNSDDSGSDVDQQQQQQKTTIYCGRHLRLEDDFFNHSSCLTFVNLRSTVEKRCKFNREAGGTNNFSLSFWMCLSYSTTSTAESNQWPMQVYFQSLRNSLNVRFRVNNQLELQFYSTGTMDTRTICEQLISKQWYHVGVVFSSATSIIKIYLDGGKMCERKVSSILITEEVFDSVRILSRDFTGSLADIAIWNRELTSVELGSIYQQMTSIDKVDVFKYIVDNNICNGLLVDTTAVQVG